MTTTRLRITVLGLGRMGSAMAARLTEQVGDHHEIRTWTRRAGGSPTEVVDGADVVLLCVYDGTACREVLEVCVGTLSTGMTVVNTATVAPSEAATLEALVVATGADYLHAPVMGSKPAVAAGRLTVLAGGKPGPEAELVLGPLGDTLVLGSSAEAAALKLVANGVLGDALGCLRRALARGAALGLPRDAVVDALGRGALAGLAGAKRDILAGQPNSGDADFTAGALAKDLRLLAAETGSVLEVGEALGLLLADGSVANGDDVAYVAAASPDTSWLADARLDVSPEVVADPAVLRPLHSYALTHATGDPSYLADAFVPTARIDGYRDGELVSWDVDEFRGRFPGEPAADEATRARRIERLDVHGSVATATMTLQHGADAFTDVFVLVRTPTGDWRIASKAYERR